MQAVCMFSGGAVAWGAAKRAVEQFGPGNVRLLFTDTLMEDGDLYRFLIEGACNVFGETAPKQLVQWVPTIPEWHQDQQARARGLEQLRADMAEVLPQLIWIAEGRDPWQIMMDERFMGNSRIDPCSKIAKRKMADRWLRANAEPSETVVVMGYDWTETHRLPATQNRYGAAGYRVAAPMMDAPYLGKRELFEWMEREGIQRSLLYRLGFAHDNCGGFCIKAGQGHFANLLRRLPDRFAAHEGKEQEARETLGDVSILTETVSGQQRRLTLRALRERIQGGGTADMFEVGGCGCFSSEDQMEGA